MKNIIKLLAILPLVFLLSSCCADVQKEQLNNTSNSKMPNNPASIAINQSTVTALIEDVMLSSSGGFIVKAFISKVEENPAYQSIALAGSTYNLIPNFTLDESKKIIENDERNRKLMLLAKGKPGDEFKAVISFENYNGWFIQEVISQ